MDYSIDKFGSDVVNAIVKPVSDKLNSQIDKIALQARKKLAYERSVPESKITDIEVAEYIANMPSQQITKEVADKMIYMGDAARNGLIIGLGLVAIAVLVVGLRKKAA